MNDLVLPNRKTLAMIVLGFFIVTFIVYGQSLSNWFVAWDDNYLIMTNPIIRGFTWQNIVNAFTSYDPELYDPLTFLTYQFDYTIGGLHAFMFHFTSLILHTLNAMLVAWLLMLLGLRRSLAIVGSLLFAVHPLNVEAVVWAAARKDVLSMFFFLASTLAYLRWRPLPTGDGWGEGQQKMYLLSLFFFLLGLLSKVVVLTLPFVLLLIDYVRGREWSLRMFVEKIPYVVLSAIFGIVAMFGKQGTIAESTLIEKILMAAKSATFYLVKLAWPTKLSVLYPYTKPITLTSPDFFIPVLVVIVMILAAVVCFKKMRVLTFAILFYLLTLFPTFFNFAKGGHVYVASDRYAYIAEIGVFFLVLWMLDQWLQRGYSQRSRSVFVGIVGVLGILGILTYKQSLTWKNTETLFLQTLKHYPYAVDARLNLGFVYSESKLATKALAQFNEALRYEPDNGLAYANIGLIYERQGDTGKAMEYYKKGMAIDPFQKDSILSLGMLYEKQGRLDDAFALYKKVEEIAPGFAGVYNNLGSIYVQRGDFANAELMYKKGIEINPYYSDAHFNLAFLYASDGRLSEAEEEYETTLRIEGDKIPTLEALAGVYAQQNKNAETIDALQRMLVLEPENAFATKLLDAIRANGLDR